jgi:hypothetical protein
MTKFTRILAMFVYGLMAAAFLAAGATTLLVNTGLLPEALRDIVVQFSQNNLGMLHVVQELGTLLVLVGLVTVWFIVHYEQSRFFHWALTTYWAIMAIIHWFNVSGPWESVVGPLINTVPFVVFLTIGLLREATERRAAGRVAPHTAREEQAAGVS